MKVYIAVKNSYYQSYDSHVQHNDLHINYDNKSKHQSKPSN